MVKHRSDILLGAVVSAFGIAVVLASAQIRTLVAIERSSIVNSRFFPRLIGFVLLVLGIVLVVVSVSKMISERRQSIAQASPASAAEVGNGSAGSTSYTDAPTLSRSRHASGVTMITCVFVLVMWEILGFLASVTIGLFTMVWMASKLKWYIVVAASLGVPVVVYVLFRFLLGVLLPQGIIRFI